MPKTLVKEMDNLNNNEYDLSKIKKEIEEIFGENTSKRDYRPYQRVKLTVNSPLVKKIFSIGK